MPNIHNNDTDGKRLHAWLVISTFTTWKKFLQLYDWLIEAAERHNIELVPLRGTDISPSIDASSGTRTSRCASTSRRSESAA